MNANLTQSFNGNPDKYAHLQFCDGSNDDFSTKSYFLNLREFKSGEFEAVLRPVKPMSEEQLRASMSGAPAFSESLKEHGLTRSDVFPTFQKTSEEKEPPSEFEKAKNHNRAVHRAKQNIRWLCKVMDADRLFTLTYRENQQDRDQTRADFKKFLRLVRSGWRGTAGVPDWQYVAVLEKQERGAYHIHCAVKGWQRIKFLRACWYKALGGAGNETGKNTPGAVNVTNPDRKRWGHTGKEWKVSKLSGYLTKYLSKTFDEFAEEKKRYWHNRDLKHPVKQRFWVGGAGIVSAIKEVVDLLELHCGMGPDFNMWLSTSNDSFWISGRPEKDE